MAVLSQRRRYERNVPMIFIVFQVCLLETITHAFLPSSPPKTCFGVCAPSSPLDRWSIDKTRASCSNLKSPRTCLLQANTEVGDDISLNSSLSSRRGWFIQAAKASLGGAALLSSNPALADDAVEVEVVTSAMTSALCDPTVSSWQKGDRIIHLLGTAHISEDSAQVAGKLVREVRPDAVFVELDAKRIGRAFPKGGVPDDLKRSSSEATTSFSTDIAAVPSASSSSSASSMMVSSSDISAGAVPPAEIVPLRRGIFSFNPFNAMQRMGEAIVGDAIKQLYKQLESQGFQPGEEFVLAIREGLNIGAVIVLGDRDVDVTLRRLTEAFRQTDFKKLLKTDSEFEQSLQKSLPEDLQKSLKSSSSDDMMLEPKQLSMFVETLKTRDNVRSLMGNLKQTAPELYEALVAERDLFMAQGLDALNQFSTIVAVMGIAHVDGVEDYLRSMNWRPIKNDCPIEFPK